MDNNLPQSNPPLIQNSPAPTTPPSASNPNLFSKITSWIRQHKKVAIGILAGILLIVVLVFGYQAIKNRFFPGTNPSSPPGGSAAELNFPSSMQVKTAKNVFTLNETIPVFVMASSNGETVTGFDTMIEYDPEFLTLTKRNPPPLTNFEYFARNTSPIFRASAILKPQSNPQPFDNTTLFEIEFTPKKTGKTVLKIIYMPGATHDSNLLNGESKDILGNAAGKEITIN